MANWLEKRPEASAEQIQALLEMKNFLINLPKPPTDTLNGEFGFEIVPDDKNWNGDHLGSWAASIGRAMFEIFSVGDDEFEEFTWELCPGMENHNNLSHAELWISQVSNPEALLAPGQKLVIDTSLWQVVQ